MQTERRVAANPQTKPVDLGCESAENCIVQQCYQRPLLETYLNLDIRRETAAGKSRKPEHGNRPCGEISSLGPSILGPVFSLRRFPRIIAGRRRRKLDGTHRPPKTRPATDENDYSTTQRCPCCISQPRYHRRRHQSSRCRGRQTDRPWSRPKMQGGG